MQVGSAFTVFMTEAEPRLLRALVARYGVQRGRDAALDAMAYGWRHWERVNAMDNPVGYLYRVGSSSVRPTKEPPMLAPVDEHREPWIEPGLERSLDTLSESQRVAVVLRHSFEDRVLLAVEMAVEHGGRVVRLVTGPDCHRERGELPSDRRSRNRRRRAPANEGRPPGT